MRLAIADDAQQVARAAAALRDQQFYVSLTVLLETEWVLRSAGLDRAAVKRTIERIIGQERAVIERREVAARALEDLAAGIDFADALHLRGASDCVAFLTFDRKLARRANRVDGLTVREP